jgi:hypothetical protein
MPTHPKENEMSKTVIGLIENPNEAQKAVDDLLKSGLDRKHIGVISPEEVARETSAAVVGASTGMAVGGLAGMLLAAAALAIPGIGPVLVAGPALTLLGGTTLGMLAGGLIGGLTARGIPEDEAHVYAEGVKRGATLVTVSAKDDAQARHAGEILKRHGAVDPAMLASKWRREGWSGRFDANARLAGKPQADAASASTAPSSAASGAMGGAAAASSAASSAASPASGASTGPAMAASSPASGQGMASDRGSMGAGDVIDEVRVYEVVIAMPDEMAPAATRPRYGGPERRMSKAPYAGTDRRIAA